MDILDAALKSNPRTRAAWAVGKKVAHSAEAKKAARLIQKMYRGRAARANYVRKKRMAQVGEDPGTSINQKTQHRSDGEVALNTNTLNAYNILDIVKRGDASQFGINTRMRDMIHLTGFKICVSITNNHTGPLYLNVAVLSAKNRSDIGDGVDFFRDFSSAGRQTNFGDTALTALDRHCNPINVDEHTVLYHRRALIMQQSQHSVAPGAIPKHSAWEFWIPVKRQIRFEGDAGSSSETRFVLAVWAGDKGATVAASDPATPIANAFSFQYKAVAYWKEPSPIYKFA